MFSKLLRRHRQHNAFPSVRSRHPHRVHKQTNHALAAQTLDRDHSSSSATDHSSFLRIASAALGLSLSGYLYHSHHREASCCGIMAMISSDEEVVEYLLEGLTILQNRGYDSAGIATLNPEELRCTKYASKDTTSDSLEQLQAECPSEHRADRVGIAHTRWATHGGKTDINAHPHCDNGGRIALVHNGTISNCTELRRELKGKGVLFHSETDTEVIANLVGHYIDQIEADPIKFRVDRDSDSVATALELALSRLDGSWGLAMVSSSRPDRIYAARNGSPLMIGLDSENHRNFIASEHTAFAKYTRNYISLNEGEMAVLTADGVNIENAKSRTKTLEIEREHFATSPAPYPFWTEKEIMEQPQAISKALQFGARLAYNGEVKLGGLTANEETLSEIKNLIITGCGTSLNAALYGQRLMQYLKSFETVQVVDSAEVISDTFPIGTVREETGVLAISQSGETKDVLEALTLADSFGIPLFSLVNAVGSAIARLTGCGVYCYAGRENAVASTKAFTSQVTCLSLIAAWFSQLESNSNGNKHRGKQLIDALHRLTTYVGAAIHSTKAQCQRVADFLGDDRFRHIFVLGKGFGECIAYEGALKIKEVTYVHAEGYSGGALKHGPFALIDENVPVIMIILDDEHSKVMVTNAHEIEARNGQMIYITDNVELLQGLTQKDYVIEIPKNGPLTALLAVVPLQMIAYYLALAKGVDPDKPRNLAKAVTVV